VRWGLASFAQVEAAPFWMFEETKIPPLALLITPAVKAVGVVGVGGDVNHRMGGIVQGLPRPLPGCWKKRTRPEPPSMLASVRCVLWYMS